MSKILGQNFLINKNKIKKIVDYLDPQKQSIEVGPGMGALTTEFLKKNPIDYKVIEVDIHMVKILSKLHPSLNIVHADVLMKDISSTIIFSNLPYSISSAFLIKLITVTNYQECFLMLQKEVYEKLIAKPFTKDYGALTVLIQSATCVQKLFDLSPSDFKPKPLVYSTFIKITPYNKGMGLILSKDFIEFVYKCFKNRRKKLSNIIKKYPNELCDLRPDQISSEQYIELFQLNKARV